jgi:hypothetical protein
MLRQKSLKSYIRNTSAENGFACPGFLPIFVSTNRKNMTIYDYAKLGKKEKQALVNASQLMEQYKEGNATVSIYCLGNFFVEVIASEGETVDFIPFERYAVA